MKITTVYSINLNDTVWVKLTLAGAKHWQKKTGMTDAEIRSTENQQGYNIFQLHDLMSIFGDQMFISNPEVMFEGNEIRLNK